MSSLVFSRLMAAVALCTSAGAQSYSISDLGTLGGPASQPYAINNSGLIVGVSLTADGSSHAFRFTGSISDLGIDSSIAVATSVNETGQIAGYYKGQDYTGFVWTQGKVHDVGNLGLKFSVAYGINGLG